MRPSGELHLGRGDRSNAAQVADREVDLAEEQHEDDAVRDHRHPGHLQDDVHEVPGGEEVRRGEAEVRDDQDLAEDDREHAEVAGLDVAESPLPEARALLGIVSPGQPDPRRDDLGVGAHDTTSGAVSAMPDTLVGIPAVIAWTTSCCVVVARS